MSLLRSAIVMIGTGLTLMCCHPNSVGATTLFCGTAGSQMLTLPDGAGVCVRGVGSFATTGRLALQIRPIVDRHGRAVNGVISILNGGLPYTAGTLFQGNIRIEEFVEDGGLLRADTPGGPWWFAVAGPRKILSTQRRIVAVSYSKRYGHPAEFGQPAPLFDI